MNGRTLTIFGIEVILDHYLLVGDVRVATLLMNSTNAELKPIEEPFKQGRHWWLVDQDGVEIHIRRKDRGEADHPGKNPHLAYRTNTAVDLLTLRAEFEANGYEVFDPSIARKFQDGVVNRFYVIEESDGIEVVTEYLYHPEKAER